MKPARHDLLITLVGLVLIVLWEASGWDREVMRWFGSRAGFGLRTAWSTSVLLHDGGRVLAGVLLALLAFDAIRPLLAGPPRRERAGWLVVTVAAMLLVPAMKRISRTSCPWDLTEFGGAAAYVPHWLPTLADGGPGHCFPSGHAVAAFAFFSVYFLWRPYRPALARGTLMGVVVCGAAFGWAQLARGAHFPSHTLWSMWLCWTLCVSASRHPLSAPSRPASSSIAAPCATLRPAPARVRDCGRSSP